MTANKDPLITICSDPSLRDFLALVFALAGNHLCVHRSSPTRRRALTWQHITISITARRDATNVDFELFSTVALDRNRRQLILR
jgi:hypothetical protein